MKKVPHIYRWLTYISWKNLVIDIDDGQVGPVREVERRFHLQLCVWLVWCKHGITGRMSSKINQSERVLNGHVFRTRVCHKVHMDFGCGHHLEKDWHSGPRKSEGVMMKKQHSVELAESVTSSSGQEAFKELTQGMAMTCWWLLSRYA